MQYAILIAPCAAVLALAFALFFARKVLKMPEAENTRGIAAIIRRGANAFLKRQYLVVASSTQMPTTKVTITIM